MCQMWQIGKCILSSHGHRVQHNWLSPVSTTCRQPPNYLVYLCMLHRLLKTTTLFFPPKQSFLTIFVYLIINYMSNFRFGYRRSIPWGSPGSSPAVVGRCYSGVMLGSSSGVPDSRLGVNFLSCRLSFFYVSRPGSGSGFALVSLSPLWTYTSFTLGTVPCNRSHPRLHYARTSV